MFFSFIVSGNNGKGNPVYIEEVNKMCAYVFEWKTKYACLGHPANEVCRVVHDGKRFDLSALVKREGKPEINIFLDIFLTDMNSCRNNFSLSLKMNATFGNLMAIC